jgi:exodeoxyribonuclease V alpha subunit
VSLSGESPAWLSALADGLAEALPRLLGEAPDPLLQELIRALTAALAEGEPELILTRSAPPGIDPLHWPEGHRRALEGSALGQPPQGPLVLEADRIVWRRWWEQRQQVLDELIRRARSVPPGPTAATADDLLQGLDPDQRRAVSAIDRHGLVLLQGGPGTGKTSTVARLLRGFLRQRGTARVHLAAPTGRAAARLRAACGPDLPCTTLHRLLESRGESFARDRDHPLALDLLVVDEMSMVDLDLMAALLAALPPTCQLVLVGDPAQLPPVAPAALLPELQRPQLVEALGEATITLRTVHRNGGAIAEVAACLRALLPEAGRDPADDPLAVLRGTLAALAPEDNLAWQESPAEVLPPQVRDALEAHRRRLAERAFACVPGDLACERALLAERDRLLVLSPRRRGRWGVEAIHRSLLGAPTLADPLLWPPGTPTICARNLPDLGLANGDGGVVLPADPEDGEPRLLFGSGDGSREAAPIRLHPAQLAGSLEPALALTVHKAQGSEAESVIVLLPAGGSQDPRLLYTALTRARERALLITPSAVARRVP